MGSFINHLHTAKELESQRPEPGVFFVYIYESGCPMCVKVLIEIYKWILSSKAKNVYQICLDQHPELADTFSQKVGQELKKDSIYMIEDQAVLQSWSGNSISTETMEKATQDYLLGDKPSVSKKGWWKMWA